MVASVMMVIALQQAFTPRPSFLQLKPPLSQFVEFYLHPAIKNLNLFDYADINLPCNPSFRGIMPPVADFDIESSSSRQVAICMF
jgi:hypothetical protein